VGMDFEDHCEEIRARVIAEIDGAAPVEGR
jgi:hypothetical protein